MLKDIPPDARPREKLLVHGPGAMADVERIALAPRAGLKGISVLRLAQQLLDAFGGLGGLLQAGPAELKRIQGLGPAKCADLAAVLDLAHRWPGRQVGPRPVFEWPAQVKYCARLLFAHLGHVVFALMFLDTEHRRILWKEMLSSALTQTRVYPREIARPALDLQAAALTLLHNHPCGVAEPSRADEHLPQTPKSALARVDVRVIDHLVVSHAQVVFFAERGLQ